MWYLSIKRLTFYVTLNNDKDCRIKQMLNTYINVWISNKIYYKPDIFSFFLYSYSSLFIVLYMSIYQSFFYVVFICRSPISFSCCINSVDLIFINTAMFVILTLTSTSSLCPRSHIDKDTCKTFKVFDFIRRISDEFKLSYSLEFIFCVFCSTCRWIRFDRLGSADRWCCQ